VVIEKQRKTAEKIISSLMAFTFRKELE